PARFRKSEGHTPPTAPVDLRAMAHAPEVRPVSGALCRWGVEQASGADLSCDSVPLRLAHRSGSEAARSGTGVRPGPSCLGCRRASGVSLDPHDATRVQSGATLA